MKYYVTLNNKNYEVEVEETEAVITAVTDAVAAPAPVATAPAAAAPAAAAPAAPAVSGDGTPVKAPMPGTILSVSAAAGQQVKSGQVIMILEAMKMENEIIAPCDGTVKQILVQKGSTVETDSVLAFIG
ncbi:MAG: acetyl-CoA carboxylase biotin carboxyl carrier protein subunit [Clostridia bacterium]|nr:acetyl-CoA carboxylase biotin carboxyl carrier protein subunit [Clostridia bacterium]